MDTKAYCSCCRKWKDIIHFNIRKDRFGFYSWCNECMNIQGRTIDYPPEEERGFGKLR